MSQTMTSEEINLNNMSLDKVLTHLKNSLPLFPRAVGKHLQQHYKQGLYTRLSPYLPLHVFTSGYHFMFSYYWLHQFY